MEVVGLGTGAASLCGPALPLASCGKNTANGGGGVWDWGCSWRACSRSGFMWQKRRKWRWWGLGMALPGAVGGSFFFVAPLEESRDRNPFTLHFFLPAVPSAGLLSLWLHVRKWSEGLGLTPPGAVDGRASDRFAFANPELHATCPLAHERLRTSTKIPAVQTNCQKLRVTPWNFEQNFGLRNPTFVAATTVSHAQIICFLQKKPNTHAIVSAITQHSFLQFQIPKLCDFCSATGLSNSNRFFCCPPRRMNGEQPHEHDLNTTWLSP